MAIKPDDCVIKLKDLETGVRISKDWYGGNKEIPVYVPYWKNFLAHVKDTTDWKSGFNAYDENFNLQLAKFNGTFKQTKKWDDRYIKFRSHRDLTLFILRWS